MRQACQQCPRRIAILHVGGAEPHQQHHAQRVHQQMTFPPADLLAGITTAWTALIGHFDRLAVHNPCRRLALFAAVLSHPRPQRFMNRQPDAAALPTTKPTVHRLPRWILFGQHPPNIAATQQEDGVEHGGRFRPRLADGGKCGSRTATCWSLRSLGYN